MESGLVSSKVSIDTILILTGSDTCLACFIRFLFLFGFIGFERKAYKKGGRMLIHNIQYT